MTQTATVTYDDFSGGEYGLIGGQDAKPNQFTGHNVLVYRNGLIGPRPGLHKQTITSNVNGVVRGFGYIGLAGKTNMITVSDKVYSTSNTGNFTMTQIGSTMSAAATEDVVWDFYDPNGTVYLSNPGDKTYAIDWTAGTSASVTIDGADRGCRTIRLYRDRLYVCNSRNTPASSHPPYRLWYSDAADFTTLPGAQYVDVGYFWDIVCLIPMGNTLLIGKRNDGWWALVGGINGTLRQVRTDMPPCTASVSQQRDVVYENGNLWFFRNGGNLCVTNGAVFDDKSWSHLQIGQFSGHRYGLYMGGLGQDIVINDEDNDHALVRHWGVWSHQYWGVTSSGPISNTDSTERIMLVGEDATAAPGKYYSFDLSYDRPGFTSDTYADPGDNSDTPLSAYFYTREHYDTQGRDLRVRQVIVDFVKWNWDGGSSNNSLALEVRKLGRLNTPNGTTDSFVSETPPSWIEPTSKASTAGRADRFKWDCNEEWSGGFQLGFTLVGVAIKQVTVVLQVAAGGERSFR